MRARRIVTATALLAASLGLLAGCSGAEVPAADGGAPSSDPPSTSAPSEMTCESIMRPSFVQQLADLGWTAEPTPFRIGEHKLDDGIQCVWGDYEHGTDVAQMYGWAPVDDDESIELQQYLEDNGWLREEGDGYVYLTEDPDVAGYVDEGQYGLTYQFAAGWVALADTKSGLALVTWRG